MVRINIDEWISFKTYATIKGLTVQAVYKREKVGSIRTIAIDGKKFVYVGKQDKPDKFFTKS